MPSAANNVKIDRHIAAAENATVESSSSSSSSANAASSSTPLRQAITVIEHKIRNLEKRKAKLESYRELQNSGKDLNSDQKTAVAKYDEVIQTLDFAKDLYKQFLAIASASEKESKKLARKEALARGQSELAKIRDVLLVQDALAQLGREEVREDFLAGRNGAAALTQTDLNLLDELYPAVTPRHEAGDATAFATQVQTAAEHLLAVVDGKPKEAFGGTYAQIKEVIGKVHESGYLDQAATAVEGENIVAAEVIVNHEVVQEVPVASIETLTIEARPPEQQPLPPEPTPEQLYYQPRPIAEVLGAGSFFFLQDSELDAPDAQQQPQQIPSQTFTNQSFVTGPPPPIPMPPHHFQAFQPQPMPPPTVVAQPVAAMGNNGVEDRTAELPDRPDDGPKQRGRPRQQQQQQQQHAQGVYQSNNGYNRPRQNRSGARTGANRQHQ